MAPIIVRLTIGNLLEEARSALLLDAQSSSHDNEHAMALCVNIHRNASRLKSIPYAFESVEPL